MTDNRIYDAFSQVRAEDALKSATLDLLRERRQRRAPRPAAWARPLAAVCAALALAVGIGSWRSMAAPVSYISIDGETSVELALDRSGRILSATAYGGGAVLEGLALKGKSYAEGIGALLDSGAYPEGGEPVFTVCADDDVRERSLLDGLGACAVDGSQCRSADTDMLEAAHSCGMSVGKYSAYLDLAALDDTVTAEGCRDMTMAEIHAAIDGHHGQGGGSGGTISGNAGAGGYGDVEAGYGHHGYGPGYGGGVSGGIGTKDDDAVDTATQAPAAPDPTDSGTADPDPVSSWTGNDGAGDPGYGNGWSGNGSSQSGHHGEQHHGGDHH